MENRDKRVCPRDRVRYHLVDLVRLVLHLDRVHRNRFAVAKNVETVVEVAVAQVSVGKITMISLNVFKVIIFRICRPKSPVCRVRSRRCYSSDRAECADGGCCRPKSGCECLGGGLDCQRCGRKVYQAEMQVIRVISNNFRIVIFY